MPEVPKIVHHRLRAAIASQDLLLQAHPEADVLTAFVEQALSTAEREGILQHMALCEDCREVVSFALPPVEIASKAPEAETTEVAAGPATAHSERKSRFAWAGLSWAHLRWATLAAGIAVAVLVMRPALQRMGTPQRPVSSAANHVAAPPVQTMPAAAIAPGTSLEASKGTVNSLATKPLESGPKETGSVESFGAKRLPHQTAPSASSFGMQLAATMRPASPAKPSLDKKSLSSGSNLEASVSAAGQATEAVEIAGANAVAETEPAALAGAPSIEKAKPPLEDTAANQQAANQAANQKDKSTQKTLPSALAAPLHAEMMAQAKSVVGTGAAAPARFPRPSAIWAIANGVLQRSFDGGRTWQTAAPGGRALLCYTNREQEVWAGGNEGTLLHSTDNGATWKAVAVSYKGQPLTSNVTHIEAGVPLSIVLSTENHETWISADGGKTWEKK